MTDNTPGFAGLPPRPDPQTGKPFPPHGRAWRGHDSTPEEDPNREIRLSHKPDPPPGKGPVLAWHKENTRGKIAGFFWSIAILTVGLIIVSLIDGDPPFDWVPIWQVWICIMVGSVLMSRPLTYVSTSAGADWFQLRLVRFGITTRKNYLDLYQLRKISVTTGPGRYFLELNDDNESIEMATLYWQADRRVWDLMYNGILHSVAAGAEVDRNARGLLELDRVRELRYPEGARTIDVTKLSDVHVWELMEDPVVRTMYESFGFQGSAAEFRKLFPEFDEDMLANPANPQWFTADTDPEADAPDSQQDR